MSTPESGSSPSPAGPLSGTGIFPVVIRPEDVLKRLVEHRTMGSAPREELAWLVEHGRMRILQPGDVLSTAKMPVEGLHVIFNGQVVIHVERGGGRRKVMEWRSGDVTGILPYSRMVNSPGEVSIEKAAEILTVPREYFRDLTVHCPAVTAILVHVMLDRARVFTSSDLQTEKMLSLGKLAAGLAHELNNPASAAARAAKLLPDGLLEADTAARALGAQHLTPEQLAAIDRVRDLCIAAPVTAVLSPLQRSDREDAVIEWLEHHEADTATAPALADTAVSFDALEELARVLPPAALDATLRWIAAGCTARSLALDVERATSRIYHLVRAVKGFTYMDRPSVPEAVDVREGLSNTMAMQGSKARSKSASVALDIPADLPRVRGFGGELNQVWLNLLDNALDAIPEGGHIQIDAFAEGSHVTVRIVDDGPGIPADIQSRIFDPFFTTKPVGQGTGLGLDLTRGIVRRHDGEIELETHPGRTEFRVILPIADRPPEGHAAG